MDLNKLSQPLEIHEIEFRIQSVNKGGYVTILAYKDARTDMNRLDEYVGHLNWKREHLKDNANCIVSIWDETKSQWVSKEDTGAESFTEKEKGLASDSFKRACFNWGIGRELYDYPVIQIKLKSDEFDKEKTKTTWNFKLKEWVWISEFKDGKLTHLSAKDQNGNERYSSDTNIKEPVQPKKETKIMDALKDITNAKTIDDIKKAWSKHKEHQTHESFINAAKNKKIELNK